MEEREIFDITIIGGGPTGLFASFYGGMRKMKVKIIDSLPQLGGQLTELYPDKFIYDVGGFQKVLAKDLVDNLVVQANYGDPAICLEESVKDIERDGDHFEIRTDKDVHYTKSILLTAGVGAFQPRKIGVEGAEPFEGKTLHYGVKDLTMFHDKKVVVLGGGDSAVDWAMMLENVASHVTLSHRREKMTAHEANIDTLMQSKVEVKKPYGVKELVGENGELQELVLIDKEGNEERLEVDHVIVNYGNITSLGPIKEWGLEMEKNSVVVNSKMETNIPGIYAAGDIATYEGKVKLIAVGFGEAPTAINNAKAYLDPKSKIQPLHSTSVFK
ncbi:thioredoxin reductase (NADPH) [Planococcus glaciei]|jgi:thioredoxin reductase|uniref:Ferredoxin--NADP reductase n=1 Tax=Planococcus glaciei TaxID=459472 RepID=A0A1G7YU97_9BACL|nr:NAD(P)/FAD-dependent oxidoreductase [Planococcus glaciei]ETP67803.1 ferredoxin--NADP reductase [Planococcus glaciei CHR43]QKX50719.1 NAD(P)/FAD-dependent oxidoreductase [Planococcus glaciei]SDH00004.1 thioredoxin reductase (NADPH) [Planococcus glaciei]